MTCCQGLHDLVEHGALRLEHGTPVLYVSWYCGSTGNGRTEPIEEEWDERGIMLTFCPFCGARVTRQMVSEAEYELDLAGGDGE